MEKENISRYKNFSRLNTNRTINNPPGVIAGRTLSECVVTMILFFGFSYANYTLIGLCSASIYFYYSLKLREKYPRSIIQHVMYGLGVFGKTEEKKVFWKKILTKLNLHQEEFYNPPAYFSIQNKISIRRP